MTGSSDRNRARGRPASGFWCQFCRATASEHSGSIITSGNYAGNSVYITVSVLFLGLSMREETGPEAITQTTAVV